MANALADQLKDLGLRHGEKAGVAIASMIFLVCAGMAASTKTIETTPDQIKKARSDHPDTNLSRHGGTARPLSRTWKTKGIKDSNFAAVVTRTRSRPPHWCPDNYKSSSGVRHTRTRSRLDSRYAGPDRPFGAIRLPRARRLAGLRLGQERKPDSRYREERRPENREKGASSPSARKAAWVAWAA